MPTRIDSCRACWQRLRTTRNRPDGYDAGGTPTVYRERVETGRRMDGAHGLDIDEYLREVEQLHLTLVHRRDTETPLEKGHDRVVGMYNRSGVWPDRRPPPAMS